MYRFQAIILNPIIALYFLFLSPVLAKGIANTFDKSGVTSTSNFLPYIAVSFILIQFLEAYAFPKKMKYVHQFLKNKKIKDSQDYELMGILLWFFHMIISVVMLLVTFSVFGLDIKDLSSGNIYFIVSIILLVLKEIYLLLSIINLDEENQLEAYKRPNHKEWKIDFILTIYSCLAYTATWDSISQGNSLSRENSGMYLLNLFIAGIIFLIFYAPIRIPYFMEGYALLGNKKDFLRYLIPIIFILFSVLYNL